MEPGAGFGGAGGAVEGIAGDGVSGVGEVDADLVGTAGSDLDLEEGMGGEAFQDAEFGMGGAAGVEAGGHAGAAEGVAGDGGVDDAGIGADAALDEGEVGFGDLAGGELAGEGAVGGVGAGDEEDAAGAFVEAVDDAGAEIAAEGGELGEVVEEGVDEGAGAAAGAEVDDEAGGLVDGDDAGVLIEDVEGDVFGEGAEGFQAGGLDGDGVAGVEFGGGLGGGAVEEDATVIDPGGEAGAGEFGQAGGEEVVEAGTGGGGVAGEGVHLYSVQRGWREGGDSRNNHNMPRRAWWLAMVGVVVAAHLCEVGVLWVEEGYPLAAAREMLRGKALYREIWFDKPPLFPAAYLLWGAQTGVALRVAGAALAVLAAWAAGRAARAFWGEREALWAAGLTAFFLTFDTHSAVMALTPDLLSVPLHFAAVGLAAAGLPFWAGVCAGAAVCVNVKGLLMLAAVLLWQWRKAGQVVAGFAIPVAAGAAWLGWQGSLGDFWRQVWVWGAAYSRDTPLVAPVLEGARRTANWGGFHGALVAGAAWAAWKEEDWKWAGWLALSAAGVVMGLRFYPRYYFHLLPVAALLAARGWVLMPRRWRWAAAALLALPLARFGPRYVEVAAGKPWADLAMYEGSARAAEVLKTRARPGETLLVWGYRPDLYALSGLEAGTRYLDSQPLSGVIADRHLLSSKVTYAELARENRAELMKARRPEWVADGLGPFNEKLDARRVMPELMSGYELAAEVAGYRLWRLRR